MGYRVKSKKVNIILTQEQQQEIVKVWSLPNEHDSVFESVMTFEVKAIIKKDKINKYPKKELFAYLNVLGFNYSEKNNKIRITSMNTKLTIQSDFLARIEHILTPGSYITLKSEEGDVFGYFFDRKLKYYEGYQELNKYINTFKLHKELNKKLSTKDTKKTKLKI